MNVFLLGDIISLVLILFISVVLTSIKVREDVKFHNMINALLLGMVFIMIYFMLDIVAYLFSKYNYSNTMVVYSANLVVLPVAAIFFFVSVILPAE